MDVALAINRRYAAKSFDPEKKMGGETMEVILSALQNCPSSVNIQPWHFIVADTQSGKRRVAKATENFPFNTPRVMDASLVVVFASRIIADERFLDAILAKEAQDGRYAKPEFKQNVKLIRQRFLGIHRAAGDEAEWLARQVYLNIGFVLMAAAALGADAVPLEGVDLSVLDKEFGLADKGCRALAAIAFGYRKNDDFNAKLPKSRLAGEMVFSKA